jgi:DNA-binding HxlR family transcriptional regulator
VRTLDVVGDRWTLLVARDLFDGLNRFNDIRDHLRIASDVLSKRLKALADDGLLEKSDYREPHSRPRQEYRLTAAGEALLPILLAMMDWAHDRETDNREPYMSLRHAGCAGQLHTAMLCTCGRVVDEGDDLSFASSESRRA